MTEGIIGFILGVLVTAAFLSWAIQRFVNKMLDQVETNADEAVEVGRIKLKVELVENQLLCYNSNTMSFVCQGSNLKEVLDNFNKQYPGQDVVLVSDDADLIEDLTNQKQLLDT